MKTKNAEAVRIENEGMVKMGNYYKLTEGRWASLVNIKSLGMMGRIDTGSTAATWNFPSSTVVLASGQDPGT